MMAEVQRRISEQHLKRKHALLPEKCYGPPVQARRWAHAGKILARDGGPHWPSLLLSLGPDTARVDETRLSHGLSLHGGDFEVALGAGRVQACRSLHGGVLLEVDALRAVRQGQEVHVALVQPELDCSRGRLCQLPHCVDGSACGGIEVAAVVDLIGDVRAKLPEEKSRPPVQHCHVHAGHCMAEQRHARSFVHTSGLGAQNSVLKGLAQANAVTTGDGVRLLDSLQWGDSFSVDLGAPSLLKLQGDLLLLVWSILGPDAHDRVHDGDGSLHGLQVLCLVAQSADIRICGVAF
mmetsp:Transcript_42067/g.58530  ORF Transcript_42067/g.58530 Transcript_42067/m.58530 type:complete len:293 (+) Transcript_42067:197-1075(+)